MLKFSRQSLIRLLIAIMAIGPVQVSMAVESGQGSQPMNCQSSMAQHTDIMGKIMDGNNCPSDQESHCMVLPVCSTAYNFFPLQTSDSVLFIARSAIHKKFIAGSDSISSYYPDLLKRPPRV